MKFTKIKLYGGKEKLDKEPNNNKKIQMKEIFIFDISSFKYF